MTVPITWYLLLAAALFAIGAFGALSRSNALTVLLSTQLMLNAANLTAIAFARQLQSPVGHVLAIIVIFVAIAEVTIGIAIFLAFYRKRRTLDLDHVDLMRR